MGESIIGQMTFKEYISKHYDELYQIVRNITNNHKDTDDLFQFVVLGLLEKEPKPMKDKQKKYYFVRVVKNNWYSNTSRFHYKFRKVVYNHTEVKDYDSSLIEEYVDENEYDECLVPEIDWVREQLQGLHWYKRDLFLLWMELKSVTEISRQTTIPLNTCGRHIREIKEYLNKLWEQEYL